MKRIKKIIIYFVLAVTTLTPSQSHAYQILFQNDTFDTVESNGILIDQDNTATDITLQFGSTLVEYIKWNSANTRFEFSDDIDLLSNQIYNARLENVTALPGGASGLGTSGIGRIVQLTVTDAIAPGCTVTACTPGTYSWDGVKWLKYAPSCGPGTYPTIESLTTTTFGTDSTTHNVSMPATVTAGDLLLVFFTNDGSATVTTPAGWTAVTTLARGTAARGSIYAKISVGTEGGTTVNFLTSGNEQGAAQVYRILSASWYGSITNGITTASYDPGAATNAPNPPALTPTWGTDYNTWLVYAAGSSWTAVTTYPTNYTTGTHTISNTGIAGASVSTARRTLNATTDDPGAFAMTTTSDGVAFTVAIRPFNCSSANSIYVDSGTSEAESSTTSGTYQNKLTVTPTFTNGVLYRIDYQFELGGGADVDANSRVQVGGVTVHEGVFKNLLYATRYELQSGFYYASNLSGTQAITIDYLMGYGGTAYIRRARILVTRLT